MEKDSAEMDLESWVILPDEGYWRTGSDPKRDDGNQLVPMVKKIPKEVLTDEAGDVPRAEIGPNLKAEQDVTSQLFLNKVKKNEFDDMTVDFPKSNYQASNPQSEMGQRQFKEEEAYDQAEENLSQPVTEQENRKNYMGSEIKDKGCWEGCSLNIWKWRVPGIGALCSLGVAAATICVLILGGNQRSKQPQNQNLQFQISNDEKSMNQAAARLNQAISATRGIALTGAHFTSGGSCISH